MEDLISDLKRWREHGADWRAIELRDDHAVVELLTCYGEPVDRVESDDLRVIEFVRENRESAD